jgi:hypothetical protein
VAGKSKDEIKALVSFLMDERTGTTGEYSAWAQHDYRAAQAEADKFNLQAEQFEECNTSRRKPEVERCFYEVYGNWLKLFHVISYASMMEMLLQFSDRIRIGYVQTDGSVFVLGHCWLDLTRQAPSLDSP